MHEGELFVHFDAGFLAESMRSKIEVQRAKQIER